MALLLTVASCSDGDAIEGAPTTSDGCGATAVQPAGHAPSWAVGGAPFLRTVIAEEGNVVGFLFADPLRAVPRDDGQNNKILWVVREPRNGNSLSIEATMGGNVVKSTEPANSSPGEIYPSLVDAPKPGCWHVTLRWGNETGNVDLLFEA